jgi:hypothetical protein
MEAMGRPVSRGRADTSRSALDGSRARLIDPPVAVQLNKRAYEHAKRLITDGRFVADDRDAWSEHRPSATEENEYLEAHGFADYGRWYLGVDDDRSPETKAHYKYPYGDFAAAHRCALLSAESRAGQYGHDDVKAATAHLHGMIDGAHASASR